MRTIKRRYFGDNPTRDYAAFCSTCGTPWPRSELRIDGDGRPQCPRCFGPSTSDLNRSNVRRARGREHPLRIDGPVYDRPPLENPHPDWEPGDPPP